MHYVIVGNGVAGITAAFTLRQRDPAAAITVIGGESDYFFSRTGLMYALMDRMTLRDLEPFERRKYAECNITLRRGWVTGLNAQSRTLRLADGATLTYSRLLLATGSAPNPVPWPGAAQISSGILPFLSRQDLSKWEHLLPATRRAVVAGGGLTGVELVECLRHHRVEVDFLVRDAWYWPMALAPEEGEIIAHHLRRHGVRLHLGTEIAEVKADANGRLAAVRTTQGGELPCQALGACIGVRPAIDWLRTVETPPMLGRGIQVDAALRTSLPDIWAAGDCAQLPSGQVEQLWYSARRHGELAALSMLGEPVNYTPPLFYNAAKFFDIEYTTVGVAAAESFFRRLPGRDVSIRIMHEPGGAVTGFNMLGSRWDHTVLETWITERRPLPYVLKHLHQAQFDVEFGRVPLAALGVEA